MSHFVISLLALIVTLGLLITFHEFGHFWVARRFGVKVLRFSIGFGKPFWLRRGQVDGTEYAVTAIPLGGYVRMLDEREGDVDPQERERAFNRQPVSSRIAIVAAGPIFNFLFAIAVYTLMFMVGVPGLRPLLEQPPADSLMAQAGFQQGDLIIAVDDQDTPTLRDVNLALLDRAMATDNIVIQVKDADQRVLFRTLDLSSLPDARQADQLLEQLGLAMQQPRLPAVIAEVQDNGAAQQAGLQAGDRVVTVDGQPIADWQQWAGMVRQQPNTPLNVGIERDGAVQTLTVIPDPIETEQGVIGRVGALVQVPDDFADAVRIVTRYGPIQALGEAVVKTGEMALFTLRMMGRMLIGKASLDNISGPITIAQFAGQSASIGLIPFLSFLALVSISLGVLNLLPVPVLDGGHLLYYFIEFVKGSPLSDTAQELGQRVGIVLLVMLMGLAFFNDLARLFG
ncbi:MAG: sigma E protease regulator RseP [Candidatus Competibacteraceae bacterium]|jgi:regulator of sigma E protease|nr:sigma E protease regulator RseP [Candidatus Competibacteraceae bacterium]